MRTRVIAGVTLAAALFLILPAGAQDQPEQRPRLPQLIKQADKDGDGKVTFDELKAVKPELTQEQFSKLDRNKDGVLTKADIVPNILALVKKADKDGDGKVTFEELQAIRPKLTEEQFAKLDRNGDGVISKADAPRPPLADLIKKADKDQDGKVSFKDLKTVAPGMTPERFARLDRNKDGVLTKEDAPQAGPQRPCPVAGPEGAGQGRGPHGLGAGGGPQGPGQGRAHRQQFLEKMKQADANGDGKVTFVEAKKVFPRMTEERFKKHDRNGDGVISKEDRPQEP